MTSAHSVQQTMVQAEVIGEDILTLKQQVIDLDKKRNSNREALRQLQDKRDKEDSRLWMFSGGMFLRFDEKMGVRLIQSEQSKIDKEIDNCREQIKIKTSQLSQLEGTPDMTAPFTALKPVNMKELNLNKFS